MTLNESLLKVVAELSEQRQHEVLDFANFLASQREQKQWRETALRHFAGAFGSDEPEYTLADVKPGLDR